MKKSLHFPPHCESECMNHGDAGVLSVGKGIFSWLTDVGYKAAQFPQQLQKVFQWNYITISIMYSRCIKKPTVCNAHSQSYLLAMRQEDRRFASTIACTEKNSWNWVIQYQPHPICDFGGQPLQVHCLPPVKCTLLQGLQHWQEEEKKTILKHAFWNWVIQHQTHPICDFDGQSLLSLQVHCLPPVITTC